AGHGLADGEGRAGRAEVAVAAPDPGRGLGGGGAGGGGGGVLLLPGPGAARAGRGGAGARPAADREQAAVRPDRGRGVLQGPGAGRPVRRREHRALSGVAVMRRPWWLAVVLGCGVVAGAGPLADGEALERNKRLLEKWRADPDHHQRLQRDLQAFYALPAAKQERLRKLDRYLHEADQAAQARRWAVVERCTSWLEALPESGRRKVKEAATPAARLAAVRALRERQWLDRLPAGLRAELGKMPAKDRAARIATLREDEKWQRRE